MTCDVCGEETSNEKYINLYGSVSEWGEEDIKSVVTKEQFEQMAYKNEIEILKKENKELVEQLEEYKLQNVSLRADVMIKKMALSCVAGSIFMIAGERLKICAMKQILN